MPMVPVPEVILTPDQAVTPSNPFWLLASPLMAIEPEPLETRRTESVAIWLEASSTPEPFVPLPWAYPVGVNSVAVAPPAMVIEPLVVKKST